MKQGNQFYLELQITDDNDNLLDITSVSKIQFNIDNITKVYDGILEDVTYDEETQNFKIWLKEEETFNFGIVNFDVRVLFKNDIILGSVIEKIKFLDVVKKENLDVETENSEA